MANSKFIDSKNLERFKKNIDNKYSSLPAVVFPTLPTTDNTPGKIVFCEQDERLYIYTSSGFKKVPWEDEILFALNEDNQICQKEV